MAMAIGGYDPAYRPDCSGAVPEGWQFRGDGNAKEALQNTDSAEEKFPIPRDEYISGERSGGKPNGVYEDPRKSERKERNTPKEECTTDTSRIDREIEKLKTEQQQVKQQLAVAGGDEKEIDELRRKLSRIENELSRKDNDAYRRQHAEIS